MPVTCYLCGVGVDSEQWRCEAVDAGGTRHFCCEAHYHYQVTRAGHTLPWSVASDPQYGRYLVASRDIAPGELVLREDCLVWGPNTGLGRPVCVECLCDVQDGSSCAQCGSPLCPAHLSAA